MNTIILFLLAWAIVFIAVFGMISPAFAMDHYETTRMVFKNNPNTCIMEPMPELQERFYNELLLTTYESVRMWTIEMDHFTNGNWYLPMQIIAYEEHHNKLISDYRECNIFIEFDKHNPGTRVQSTALGWTAYDHSKSVHPYAFIMIYTEALKETGNVSLCIGCDDELEQSLEFSSEMQELDERAIKRIIRHEFGHALGLGHYIEDKDKSNNVDSLMYPIMDPFGYNDIYIEEIDKIILREIYGADGFGGLHGFSPKYFKLHVAGQ